MTEPVNIQNAAKSVSKYWNPKIISQFNDCEIMVAKIKGEYHWHSHTNTDDFFLVIEGEVVVQTECADITLSAGELYVVPKGVQHRPIAREEATILLIEKIKDEE